MSALHVTTRDEVLARVVSAISKARQQRELQDRFASTFGGVCLGAPRSAPDWSGATAGDVLTILEALGLIQFETPPSTDHDRLRAAMSQAPISLKVGAGTVDATAAEHLLAEIERAGFKIVRA